MIPNRKRLDLTERYFSGLTEQTFQSRLGVVDPELVDYLSRLLVRFIHRDGLYSVRSPSGRRLNQVSEMVAEAEQRTGKSRFQIYRHIGDFTLFWTGVYPEALQSMKADPRADRFVDYCSQGKRSYMIAASIELEEQAAAQDNHLDAELLHRLSAEFEMCAYGLQEVRKEWERQDLDEDGQPSIWVL